MGRRVIWFGVGGSMMRVMIRPYGFESPYVSSGCAKNVSILRGKCNYPVLMVLLENLVELVKVRLRVLTRRLK